jgi:hypothetical protein
MANTLYLLSDSDKMNSENKEHPTIATSNIIFVLKFFIHIFINTH